MAVRVTCGANSRSVESLVGKYVSDLMSDDTLLELLSAEGNEEVQIDRNGTVFTADSEDVLQDGDRVSLVRGGGTKGIA